MKDWHDMRNDEFEKYLIWAAQQRKSNRSMEQEGFR